MFRDRRFAKPVLALIAVGAVVLAVSGCAIVKPGSFTVSQPGGVGSARVHFVLCTGSELLICGPNEDTETLQYLAGIAVPPGSTPPATFTATPVGGGSPIVFTRNDEVASETASSSQMWQALLNGAVTPEEKEEAELFKQILGGVWPPSGLQGFGYLSGPVQETKDQSVEWSVDADFGLPVAADGAPFAGPFTAALALGTRGVGAEGAADRPIHCVRIDGGAEPGPGDAFCPGTTQQAQIGTADLKIGAPKKPAQAFVGGSAELAFPLRFAGTAATVPTFALSATTTAKGGKAKLAPKSFTPGALDPSTHKAPNGTGKVTVSVPPKTKPKTYTVTITAKTPQGGTATQVGKLKVTKPKLKFGAAQLDAARGIATLKVKVPSGGKLTVSGKGVKTVKKKSKKKKTLKVKVTSTGATSALLARAGSARVKVKATFKPTSGISVKKTKSIVLKLR